MLHKEKGFIVNNFLAYFKPLDCRFETFAFFHKWNSEVHFLCTQTTAQIITKESNKLCYHYSHLQRLKGVKNLW